MPSVPAEDADVPKEPDGTGASGEEEPGGDWEEGETAVLYIGTRAGGFTKYPFTYTILWRGISLWSFRLWGLSGLWTSPICGRERRAWSRKNPEVFI